MQDERRDSLSSGTLKTRSVGARRWLAVALNVLVPGAGLIVARREWLGAALAVLYGVLAEATVVGIWLWPAAVPAWLTRLTALAAALVWLGAQWLLAQRVRVVFNPALDAQVVELCRRGREAMHDNDYAEAHALLMAALALNDEAIEPNRCWADLMTRMGRFREATHAWLRVLRLDKTRECQRRAKTALASLPGR